MNACNRALHLTGMVLVLIGGGALAARPGPDLPRTRRSTRATAPAAPAAARLSLQAAVDAALASYPELSAGRSRIQAAAGLEQQAGLRPNPRLFFQMENLRAWSQPPFQFSTGADTFIYASQVLETAGKRGRRVGLARANLQRSQLEQQLLRAQVIGAVKQAYWQAVGTQRLYELRQEDLKNFDQIVAYHRNRVREGAMAEADLLRVEAESERLRIEADNAHLEAGRARIALFQAMGRASAPASVTFADSLTDPAPAGLPGTLNEALGQRPEMKIAREAIVQTQQNQRLQQALAKPDVDVLLGYKRTEGFDTVIGGVQVNLPFSDRNQGNIAAAVAEGHAARADLQTTGNMVSADYRTAVEQYLTRRRQLESTLQPLLNHAIESSKIAQAAYREGGADLLRLLDAERIRIETEQLYTRSLMEYQQSIAALQTALGAQP